MKFLHFVVFCFFLALCAEASLGLEVNGHAGGEVSIPCSGNYTANGSSGHATAYFCKGVCSRETVLIRTEGRQSAVAHRGRYSAEIDAEDGIFTVTIKNLRNADSGLYYCGVGTAFNALRQHQISLIVLDAPTVPRRLLSIYSNTTQFGTDAALQGNFQSSPEPSAAAAASRTPPPSEEKKNQQGVTKLTGTTVVIIVSGSLAFLVCAIIPVIFCGHWRSSQADQSRFDGSKDEGDYSEQNADVASAHVAVGLQSVGPKVEAEGSAQDSSQYAAIYQALDPSSLD